MAVDPDKILSENYSKLTTRVDKVHYLWEIHNYSFLNAKCEDLRSPIFTAATNDKCKWYLSLTHNDIPEHKKFIRLSLNFDRSSECKAVFAAFSVFILDSNQKKIHSKENKNINRFDKKEGKDGRWGYSRFILEEDLLTDKFLPNNKLTIYLEATFSDVESSIDILDQSISNHLEHRVLENDHFEDFERLWKSRDFTDIVISVKSKRFQVHKFILVARSPVFAAMFKHNTKESSNNEVEITDMDENVVEEMLLYMYTGKFRNLDGLASDLLKVADKYGMEDMKAKCENVLLKNLSVENAADALVLADLYRASALKSLTINFIAARSIDVVDTETWNKMVFSHPHLINEEIPIRRILDQHPHKLATVERILSTVNISHHVYIDYMAMAVNPGILPGNYSSFNTRVDKLHYSWVMHNYNFLVAKGEDLRSPIFTAATNDKCKWYLLLKPNGESDSKKYISLYVGLDPSSECRAVFAAFSIFILDGNQKKIHSADSKILCRFDMEGMAEWGFSKFILKENLTDKFLPNNKLTIYFEATFSDVESSINILESTSNHLEHRVLKDDPLEDFERLLKSQDFTDIVISVKGKRFQAHKSILVARSPVFAAMFKHDTKERRTNGVEITDIDENVIEEMLYYIYTGKFRNLDGLASDLLKAADKYGMDGMKAKCENALLKNLSIENAADTLVLADLYRASELKSRTINFIAIKSADVMNTETWNKMVFSHPHLINEVCKASLSCLSL